MFCFQFTAAGCKRTPKSELIRLDIVKKVPVILMFNTYSCIIYVNTYSCIIYVNTYSCIIYVNLIKTYLFSFRHRVIFLAISLLSPKYLISEQSINTLYSNSNIYREEAIK